MKKFIETITPYLYRTITLEWMVELLWAAIAIGCLIRFFINWEFHDLVLSLVSFFFLGVYLLGQAFLRYKEEEAYKKFNG